MKTFFLAIFIGIVNILVGVGALFLNYSGVYFFGYIVVLFFDQIFLPLQYIEKIAGIDLIESGYIPSPTLFGLIIDLILYFFIWYLIAKLIISIKLRSGTPTPLKNAGH